MQETPKPTNGIPAPTYTQIPNVVIDYWANQLDDSELRVLLLICRCTFGWHQPSADIPLNYIAQSIGRSRSTVKESLNILEKLGLIERDRRRHENRSNLSTRYRLVLNTPHDEVGDITPRPVDRPTPRPVGRPTPRPVDRPTPRPVGRPSIFIKKGDKERRETHTPTPHGSAAPTGQTGGVCVSPPPPIEPKSPPDHLSNGQKPPDQVPAGFPASGFLEHIHRNDPPHPPVDLPPRSFPLQRVEEFVSRYPSDPNPEVTRREYMRSNTPESEAACHACLERYLASDQVRRGIVMRSSRWLHEQKLNHWGGDWSRAKTESSLDQKAEDYARRRREEKSRAG